MVEGVINDVYIVGVNLTTMTELLPKIELQKIAFFEDEGLRLLKHDYNKVAQMLNTQSDKLTDDARKELHRKLMMIKHRINFYN